MLSCLDLGLWSECQLSLDPRPATSLSVLLWCIVLSIPRHRRVQPRGSAFLLASRAGAILPSTIMPKVKVACLYRCNFVLIGSKYATAGQELRVCFHRGVSKQVANMTRVHHIARSCGVLWRQAESIICRSCASEAGQRDLRKVQLLQTCAPAQAVASHANHLKSAICIIQRIFRTRPQADRLVLVRRL